MNNGRTDPGSKWPKPLKAALKQSPHFQAKNLKERLQAVDRERRMAPIYDIAPDGHLIGSRGKERGLPSNAPGPGAIGTVDWAAKQLFESREAVVQMAESLIGASEEGEGKWLEFCRQYREWERLWEKGLIEREPTLNDVCAVLRIPHQEFFGWLASGIATMMQSVGRLKASLAGPRVVDLALAAAADPANGTKDREMLLKMAGLLESGKGVQVNVTQQNAFVGARDKERAKSPLLQFSQTITEIDEMAREGEE